MVAMSHRNLLFMSFHAAMIIAAAQPRVFSVAATELDLKTHEWVWRSVCSFARSLFASDLKGHIFDRASVVMSEWRKQNKHPQSINNQEKWRTFRRTDPSCKFRDNSSRYRSSMKKNNFLALVERNALFQKRKSNFPRHNKRDFNVYRNANKVPSNENFPMLHVKFVN